MTSIVWTQQTQSHFSKYSTEEIIAIQVSKNMAVRQNFHFFYFFIFKPNELLHCTNKYINKGPSFCLFNCMVDLNALRPAH